MVANAWRKELEKRQISAPGASVVIMRVGEFYMSPRTKIIATLGPASRSERVMRSLIDAGANAFRINFSYGNTDEHAETVALVRRLSGEVSRHIAVIQDLQGPKIRVGKLETGPITARVGEELAFASEGWPGRSGAIPVKYPALSSLVNVGDRILLGDGEVELEVQSVAGPVVLAVAKTTGAIRENQGVVLPDSPVRLEPMTEKDVADLHAGLRIGVDYVAMSLVRDAGDVRRVKQLFRDAKRRMAVIAKVERREAIEALDGIIAVADGVMVARGDLGLHYAPEKLPLLQKWIIRQANQRGVMAITATQMLESMIRTPRPTRAEATDVANAVLDGTDAVMLSGETAIGEFPIDCVQMMSRIVVEAEKEAPASHLDLRPDNAHSLARAAVRLAEDVGASAVVVFARSGYTARLVSAERPRVPVLALAGDEETASRLALLWGITPVVIDAGPSLDDVWERAEPKLVQEHVLTEGGTVVIARLSPRGGSRGANFVRLHTIGRIK